MAAATFLNRWLSANGGRPKGMVAQSHAITPDQAFDMLRTYRRRNNLKLTLSRVDQSR